MAALTSIRSKGKLIAICVGGALLAFVLGDFINSGATIFGASQTKMGEINGNSVDYNEFMAKVNNREQFMKTISGRSLDSDETDQIREYCWQQEIRENTIGQYADKQGIRVTDEEVQTLVNTGNVTSMMRQMASQQTGMYNPAFFSMYLQQAQSAMNNPDKSKRDYTMMYIWNNLEQELRDERKLVKYVDMVSAGLYVTKAEVEQEFANRTQMADIRYVAIPFTDINDAEVTVTDADIIAAFEKNKKRLELMHSQETRDIAYVSFDVLPSEKDSAEALKIAEEVKAGLETADAAAVKDYVNSKSDVPFVDYYYGKGDIKNDDVDSLVFAEQPGFVYGPYVEGGYYNVARLISKEMRADSVEVSFMVLASQTYADTTVVKAKADSLLDVYNQGIDFNALAAQYSMVRSAAQDSGKIGWLTQSSYYLPASVMDVCFATPKGATAIAKDETAYYIIKVTDKTAPKEKVSVGFARIDIRPSSQTRQEAYAKASQFAGTNRTPEQFKAAVEADKSLLQRVATVYASQRGVNGVENSRELVRWAFNDDESKEVSYVKEFGDRYIVAALTGVHKKDAVQLADHKLEMTVEATNAAKANAIISKLGNVSSVDAAAAQMGKTVMEANNVNFEMSQIPGMGFEPNVIATVASLGQNQVSAPIKGKTAVYVVQNVSVTPAQAIQPLNITTDQTKLMMDSRNRAAYQILQVAQKLGNIDDRRAKFF